MPNAQFPTAFVAVEAAPRTKPTNYPEPFASRMAGREKRPLGDPFGLRNFGVNLTRLAPGGSSALRHAHSKQDEFVYILAGHPTLITGRDGSCARNVRRFQSRYRRRSSSSQPSGRRRYLSRSRRPQRRRCRDLSRRRLTSYVGRAPAMAVLTQEWGVVLKRCAVQVGRTKHGTILIILGVQR